MSLSKPLHSSSTVLLAIAISCATLTQPVAAQATDPPSIQDTQIIFNDPRPPRQGSPTGRQRGGASRGPCRQFEALTAMVPAQNGVVWGQTMSDRPTVWVYLPQPLTANTPIEFTLQDDTDTEIYTTRLVATTQKPGLIRLTIPNTAKALEKGQSYTWTLSVDCEPGKPSAAVFVKGRIQRIEADEKLQNRLKTLSPSEQSRVYAANGIWYDAFDTLATLYSKQPSDRQLNYFWTTLLKQVNLSNFSTIPFSPCCTLPPK